MTGLTLPEVMVAVGLNALLLTAFMSMFIASLIHYEKVMASNRLNQELQVALLLMTTEIRRAGYWANAHTDLGTHQNNNPFMASGVDLTISGSCILFAYDTSKNGVLPAISASYDDERYGFRLMSNAIQVRPPGAAFDCSASADAWEDMTDSNVVRITALTFTPSTISLNVSGTSTLALRSVDITVTGELTNDASVTKTLTEHVKVRNDKFNP